jgi:hypothetical protein
MKSRVFELRSAAAVLGGLLLATLAAAGEGDGPYVMRTAAGKLEAWSVEQAADGPRKHVDPLAANARIKVAAVGDIPAFEVTLRPPPPMAPDSVTSRAKAPLFVVADTHGEYEIFAHMLVSHHVVDGKLHWSFGRGYLVILGDVFDRGAHHTEILWLIYALEAEARKAGGGVAYVLGNHEDHGDARRPALSQSPVSADGGGARHRLVLAALWPRQRAGQWLRSKATVMKVNDLLCLHGGISRELVERKLTLAAINGTVRAVLNDGAPASDADRERAEFLLGERGPLWYRGYFSDAPGGVESNAEDIDRIRKFFGVTRILVGHTRVPSITPLYEGKVIAVQVYPRRRDDGSVEFEALLIRDGELFRARPDGSSERLSY